MIRSRIKSKIAICHRLHMEVFEGQVFMSEDELKPFLVEEKDILTVVLQRGTKS